MNTQYGMAFTVSILSNRMNFGFKNFIEYVEWNVFQFFKASFYCQIDEYQGESG